MSNDLSHVAELARRMGDNCLILGQRLSEWCGKAPALEEDIALANTALDLIGQTQLWYGTACEIMGDESTPDTLAFLRDSRDFKNFLLVEYPNEDYAITLMRQFLFDAWHYFMLEELIEATNADIVAISAKSIKEVRYHRQRSADLVHRLGNGSDESRSKMQNALNTLWRFAGELTEENEFDSTLATIGLVPGIGNIAGLYNQYVQETLTEASLTVPDEVKMRTGGRKGLHSEAFGFLLAEMQSVHRSHPGAQW